METERREGSWESSGVAHDDDGPSQQISSSIAELWQVEPISLFPSATNVLRSDREASSPPQRSRRCLGRRQPRRFRDEAGGQRVDRKGREWSNWKGGISQGVPSSPFGLWSRLVTIVWTLGPQRSADTANISRGQCPDPGRRCRLRCSPSNNRASWSDVVLATLGLTFLLDVVSMAASSILRPPRSHASLRSHTKPTRRPRTCRKTLPRLFARIL